LKEYKPWFDEVMITITLWLLVLSELYQLTWLPLASKF
jgi:hypothetical protein